MVKSMKINSILAIILNWNELDLTRRCLRSLLNQKRILCDILVIDNNSDMETFKILLDEFPDVQIKRNPTNLGVSAGRNIGIRYALKKGYEFILLFDNDALAESYMLSHLIETVKSHPEGGIFGPKIYRDDLVNVIWRAGCTSWKWTYLHAGHIILKRIYGWAARSLPRFLDTMRGENQPDAGQYDVEQEVDFQIGCAQLIRTAVFKDVGLLDEEFSPYGSEDIDFCTRVQAASWRIRYVPHARCWHRVGGSFQDEYWRTYYNTRNLLLIARKNLNPIYFWLLYLPDFIILTIPLMLIESTLKKNIQRRKAFIEAILWNLSDIKKRGILIGTREKN